MGVSAEDKGRKFAGGGTARRLLAAAAVAALAAGTLSGAQAQWIGDNTPDKACAKEMARYGVTMTDFNTNNDKGRKTVYTDGTTASGQTVRMRCSTSKGAVVGVQVFAPPAFGSSTTGSTWTDATTVLGEPKDVPEPPATDNTKVAATPPAGGQGAAPEGGTPDAGGKKQLPGGNAELPGGNAELPGSNAGLPDAKMTPEGGAAALPDGKTPLPEGQTAQLPDGKSAPQGGTVLPQGEAAPTQPVAPTAPQPGLFKKAPTKG